MEAFWKGQSQEHLKEVRDRPSTRRKSTLRKSFKSSGPILIKVDHENCGTKLTKENDNEIRAIELGSGKGN